MTNITIVGGGTSGWSAAAFLSKNPKLNVTIVEPSDIPTIGVGESTIPYINITHKEMELDVFDTPEWINKVDGSLKFSIEFANFNRIGETWIHPFLVSGSNDNIMSAQTCSSHIPLNIYQSQPDYVNDNYILPNIRSQTFVEPEGQNEDGRLGMVGYHNDAGKYAQLLKDESLKRSNLSLIDAHVTGISVKDENITNLILSNGDIIDADLFIDCTGFRALLANAVGSKWDTSYSERLYVDSALAVQLPYIDRSTQMRNTTYCHALQNGWVWNVPLQTRIGTGYVYSSRHTSEDDARMEFKKHLNEMYGYNKEELSFRKLDFGVGIRRESWKNNVIAIGLSSFFLEPIESTAISTMHHQISTVYNMLMHDYILPKDKIKRFNEINNLAVDAIASYIELHYTMTKRTDSQFWRDVASLKLTDEQKNTLDLYINPNKKFDRSTLKATTNGHSMFDQSSYLFLYLGYDLLPNNMYSMDDHENL